MQSSPLHNGLSQRTSRCGITYLQRVDTLLSQVQSIPFGGGLLTVCGTLLITLGIIGIERWIIQLPNPGLLYLPLVAMLAYHRGMRHALVAIFLQLLCVYLFFLPPASSIKGLAPQSATELVILAAVTGFVLLLAQFARHRHARAEQAIERLTLLNRVGTALVSELEEARLLHLIAETACTLTGAGFAAFTVRPTDELGHPTVPSEGHLFHLAAIVGVTQEQERIFQRMPLGGEGLLAPIFRQGVPVRVADVLDYLTPEKQTSRDAAREAAFDYAHGHLSKEGLRGLGLPPGHHCVRSFLGAPLLDRNREVRGGLLLGHTEPGQFTSEHEHLLIGLAAQASVALENARLYRLSQMHAQELHAIFESIADGVTLVDAHGYVLRENRAASRVHDSLQTTPDYMQAMQALLHTSAQQALAGDGSQNIMVCATNRHNDCREYLVTASPLRFPETSSGLLLQHMNGTAAPNSISGAVVTWHDVTEERRLAAERRVHAETEERRALLQLVLDELPTSVYLVRGPDARLVLANQAATTVWGATWKYGQPMREFLAANAIRIFGGDGLALTTERLATFRAVQQGEIVRQHQEVIRHPDGSSLPVIVNAVALDAGKFRLSTAAMTPDTNPASERAALVVHQDVTALKEAERLKDDFIGIAAHELRTPLAVLKGYAQMLLIQSKRKKGPALVDWQVEALEGIDQATQRLVELTEDLLDVTRLQAGRLSLQVIPTDLIALTKRVIKRLQLTTERHTFSLASETEHAVVDVDPQRLEQVLGNLLSNAIKYSLQGGPIEVFVRAEPEACVVLLGIADHGIGIPAHQQGQIFGRFMRADNARASDIGGTGLGLYLCRELIERQGGRIWFESTEGVGSTFFVMLPMHELADQANNEEPTHWL